MVKPYGVCHIPFPNENLRGGYGLREACGSENLMLGAFLAGFGKTNARAPTVADLGTLVCPRHYGALVAHQHSFAPPRCRTSQDRRILCPSQRLFRTILVTLCLMLWDLLVVIAILMPSCWHYLLFCFVSNYFLFFTLPWVGCVGGGGVFGLIECSHSLPALHY